MRTTVVVVGGGYGGTAVAKALDDVADVVLVEPRDLFVHNVAALRGLVDPEWTDRIFFPYDRLLERGRLVHDRVVHADATGVTVGSGQRIDADYLVLATGSGYPFPAKTEVDDSAEAKARLRTAREALLGANDVLLLGAGPAGLELAGEIKAVWPGKPVTIVDPATEVLAEFPAEVRTELRRQLDELGVELVLGDALGDTPPSQPGELKTFTATTRAGREITADIWFRCFGVTPVSGYLNGDLAAARRPDGHVEVTPQLRIPGQERVFAVGDLTALPEGKLARAAGDHAAVVAGNIRALIAGEGELATYEPAAPGIALPLGPAGGVTYTPETGLLGAEQTSQIKGQDLAIGRFAETFGLA
ncbi:NAD(P)/FAD-dependent oxidoreductase [Saccharopolyspora taberi]|uniref:FAD/NAD(P)-binding domain-containing protein n=1 Tax=Saccharopolyspora taberi TaxID=60895 RepID=A0ABN3VKJ1_9PSEU